MDAKDPRNGPLYKYMRREHAEAFFRQGTVRVGTLHEYLAIDKLGEEVGDRNEGMMFCSIPREDIDLVLSDAATGYLKTWVRQMVASSPEARLFGKFVACYMSQDQYAYCLTEEYSEDAMNQFGYDSCVRIDDVRGFLSCLSQDLEKHAKPVALMRCQYRSRGFEYHEAEGIVPVAVKGLKYAYQKEIRALWSSVAPWSADYHPIDNPAPRLSALLIADPRLPRFCTAL